MVVVQNVSKLYRLYNRPADRLLEALPFVHRKRHREFWALQDISFEVGKGEILGLVGPNGSGKSTVLQIVSGILQPTRGRVSVEGRIAALLELGAGFNPEFSGRENVFLNGEIMGLSRRETEVAFPSIAAFAEIGDFMDRPVKEYSSGMYVRLAFATAIHVEPEVLIVDEALAVGDAIFANRCLRKLQELKDRNTTILFVSHDLGIVKRLCHRALLLFGGKVICSGTPSDVVNRYVGLVHDSGSLDREGSSLQPNSRHGDGASRIEKATILNHDEEESLAVLAGKPMGVRIHVKFSRPVTAPIVGVLIRNRLGMEIFGTNTRIEGISLPSFDSGDELDIDFRFECFLTRQEYTLTVATQNADGSSQDWQDDALSFTVIDETESAGVARFRTQVSWERSSQSQSQEIPA